MLLSVLALCFCPKLLFLQYSTMRQVSFHVQHNTKQTCLVPFSKTPNNPAPQTTIKQARFYKPCIYDKQLGFNKPAVVIADCLFADFRHLCFNGCLRDMRHIRSKSGSGTNTPQIADAPHKQALIKYYCFYDQTSQNYPTANNPNKQYLHFTSFSRPKS